MADCEYCGKPAGWFRSYHAECRSIDIEQRIAKQKKAEETSLAMRSLAAADAQSGGTNNHLEDELASLAAGAGLTDDSIREALIAGFEEAASGFTAHYHLTAEDEVLLTGYGHTHKLTTEELDRRGTWTRLGKLAVLRDVADGKIPDRVQVSGNFPFVLNASEKIVWLFNDARVLKQKTTRGQTFWVIADQGILAISSENLLFSGPRVTARISLHQIVTLIEGKDGFTAGKGSAQKPFVLITGDGHFSTNLVRGLAEIRSQEVSSRAVRNRVLEAPDATLIGESEWPQLPELATLTEQISVESQSGNGVYHVVLSSYTCDCPDWIECRAKFPERDVRRICKHIALEMIRKRLLTDPIIRALLVVGGCPPYNAMQKYQLRGNCFYFFHTEGYEWIDVVAKSKICSDYGRFGYSIERNGWSYGRAPNQAAQVKRLLRNWCTSGKVAGGLAR